MDNKYNDYEPVCINCDDEGCDYCEADYDYEDDGQPTEYDEWQDVFGGDEDPGDYDQFEGNDDY